MKCEKTQVESWLLLVMGGLIHRVTQQSLRPTL